MNAVGPNFDEVLEIEPPGSETLSIRPVHSSGEILCLQKSYDGNGMMIFGVGSQLPPAAASARIVNTSPPATNIVINRWQETRRFLFGDPKRLSAFVRETVEGLQSRILRKLIERNKSD